ncbi:transposase family protein [Brevibacillus brevis]|uniref:Transposase family protein n=1 Tax=Brevibacillus brevis TaxID=1393 RepID=A0A517IGP6_BREBE|nr:transposase family protein [Brevibacillus brevis]
MIKLLPVRRSIFLCPIKQKYLRGEDSLNHIAFTLDIAHQTFPDAKPIFHSDRGFQYANKKFKEKLDDAGITQSISRVARCIDNGPMESFWGMIKTDLPTVEVPFRYPPK